MQDNKIYNILHKKIKYKMINKILKDNLNRIPCAYNKINKKILCAYNKINKNNNN